MVNNPYSRKDRAAVLAAFFINGALMATWVSRIPELQSKLGLNEGTLGLVLFGLPCGMLIALLLAGNLIAQFGSRKVVLAAGLAACTALPLLALASYPMMLFAFLFLFGGGISVMDVAMNEQGVLVERTADKPMMSSFHGGYSIGGVFGSLIAASLAALPGFSVLFHFILVALFFITSIFFTYPHLKRTQNDTSTKGAVFQLPARALWVMGAIALASAIGEGAASDWSAVYLKNIILTSASTAALGFGAFSATMTLGRFFGDWVTSKVGPSAVVRAGGLIAALGFTAALLTDDPGMAIAGFALVGLGLSNIIPQLFGAAGNVEGINPGTGIAGVATIGYIGFLIGPPLIGSIAQATSLRISFILVALIVGSLLISARAIAVKK